MGVLSKKFGKDLFEAEYAVEETQHGMRLDQFMQIYLQSFSREAVKQKILSGDVQIIGRPGKMRPSSKLHKYDVIYMITKKTIHEDEYFRGEKLELELTPRIILEDDNILVISKPAYMSTHPTGKHLFNCATVFFESLFNKTVHSVHRLDRETSGVLVLAKNPDTANQLTTEFEESRVKKCYFFISKHNDERKSDDQFFVDNRLGSLGEGLKRIYIDHFPKDAKEGKSAHTNFKILHRFKDYSIGLAFPRTGRQHQIRVHAMIAGFPLLGDKLYLGTFKMFQRFKDNIATESDHDQIEISRHALHAIGLKIKYGGAYTNFIDTIPTDLKEWITKNLLDINLLELEKLIKDEIEEFFK